MSALYWILALVGFFVVFWTVLFAVWWRQGRREDRLDASIPTPRQHLMHPVLGHLVPDGFGGLMTFRRFEFMRLFWKKAEQDIADFSPYERVCIEKWEEYMLPLVRVHRRGGVSAMLRSKGVFEVNLDGKQTDSPTASQEAAYKFFLTNEEKICANVRDALLRYYHVARKELPDWFDKSYPDNPEITQLAEFVDFGGFTVRDCLANGISPLLWSWRVRWDEEHGMGMILFRDQVIMMDQNADCFLEAPAEFLKESIWRREHMIDAERAALDELLAGSKPK